MRQRLTGERYTTIHENARSLYDSIWFDRAHLVEYTGHNKVDALDVTVFGGDDLAKAFSH